MYSYPYWLGKTGRGKKADGKPGIDVHWNNTTAVKDVSTWCDPFERIGKEEGSYRTRLLKDELASVEVAVDKHSSSIDGKLVNWHV